MAYEVTVERVDARPTAVVAASTTWARWPDLLPVLLGEVWACLRAGGVQRGCPNVVLYRDTAGDAEVDVEVGVELRQPCPLTGRVAPSTLPAGDAVTTIHHGPYAGLGSAYDAIARWCDRHRRSRAATRWEVYGPHRDDPAELTTQVFWLLSPGSPA
jgi:effector-binding domain-containing protein